MAALRGARAPLLREFIPLNLVVCFASAAQAFEHGLAVAISPSLGTIGAILRDQVAAQFEPHSSE